MALTELWWRSRFRQAIRRRFLARRRPPAQIDDDGGVERKAHTGGPGQRFGAVVVGAVLALLGAELLLRVPGLPMPRDLSTYLFQCYYPEYEPARILFESQPLYLNLHKPSFEASCHWNGYSWRHRTDQWGGRNPESWSNVDVVLLGDSMIYGHGVEEEQTASHFLRERLKVKVANLAVMGDSFPQYVARLRNFALPLHPRLVFVFAFGGNDLSDVIHVRSEKKIREFIDHGSASEARILPRDLLLGETRPTSISRAIEHHALVYRTLRFFLKKNERRNAPATPPATVPDSAPSPTGAPPNDVGQEEQLALDYIRAALTLMRDSAKRAHTELVLVYLPGLSQRDAREDRLVFHRTRAMAKDLGLRFVDASPVQYADGHPVSGARLEYDGHLSEAGHRRLAALLADFIERNGLLEPAQR